VAFTSPAADDVVGGAVDLSVSVEGSVLSVEYLVNGEQQVVVDQAPWSSQWDVSDLSSGTYTLTVVAMGEDDATAQDEISVQVDTEAPSVQLATPGMIEVVDAAITYDAMVTDNVGLADVTVSVGQGAGVSIDAPYNGEFDVTQLEAGTYVLIVTAVDLVGLTGSDDKEFLVDRPPTVAFTNPAEGGTVIGAVDVAIEAADDVELDRVEFFVDGTHLGNFAGGQFLWEPDFGLETAVLRAVAYDGVGQSAEQTISVNLEASGEYDFDGGLFSWVSSMELEGDGNVGADVDNDGDVDNALGPLLNDISNIVPSLNVNEEFGRGIRTGELAIGVGWPGNVDVQNDEAVRIDVFDLVDVDDDPATHDEYYVSEASFLPGTEIPWTRFVNGEIDNGVLSAGPSIFRLVLPLGPIALTLEIQRAVLGGTVAFHNGGVALRDGTLSGAVPWVNLIGAVNSFLQSPNCSCLDLDSDLIDPETNSCAQVNADECTGPQETCGLLVNSCGILVAILSSRLDLDLDDNGEVDAFSVFLHLGAEGTDVLGIAQ
jgi:hypothetical protein